MLMRLLLLDPVDTYALVDEGVFRICLLACTPLMGITYKPVDRRFGTCIELHCRGSVI